MFSSLQNRIYPYTVQGLTAIYSRRAYQEVLEEENYTPKCVGCDQIFHYYCPVHWKQFAEERLEDVVEVMGGGPTWWGRFSMNHIHDYTKDYELMRKFFSACCNKYPGLRYVWVKHLKEEVYIHWHVLFWGVSEIDVEFIRGRYKRLLNKYTEEGYERHLVAMEECMYPVKMLEYMLGLNKERNPEGVAPWSGPHATLCRNVVDGNAIYHGRRDHEVLDNPF